MQRALLFLTAICLFSLPLAAQTVPSAKTILDEAYATAAKEKKNVFIIFHSSWCGWCRKLDTAMNDASCKKYFQDNYVVRHLVVMEEDKSLENAGADEVMAKYKGNNQGVPFFIILDKKGNLIGDSKGPDGKNIGCPATDGEIAVFLEVLKKTSKLKATELAAIETRFRKNRPQQAASR